MSIINIHFTDNAGNSYRRSYQYSDALARLDALDELERMYRRIDPRNHNAVRSFAFCEARALRRELFNEQVA